MEGARFSIVRDTAFRPQSSRSTIRKVVSFEGKKNLLAPTGD
jgi:hypothetical protein